MLTEALRRDVAVCWWASAVAWVILVAGCVAFPTFQVSVPREVPAGVRGQINDEIIQLNLDTVTVALQMQNSQTGPGGAPRPLGLWLEIGSAVLLDDVQRGNPHKGVRTPELGPVSVEGKRCFIFWFGSDPSPNLSFIVSIRGGVPVAIPDVHFVGGTVRKTVIP